MRRKRGSFRTTSTRSRGVPVSKVTGPAEDVTAGWGAEGSHVDRTADGAVVQLKLTLCRELVPSGEREKAYLSTA